MEATKLFHWFIAIYLPTIGATITWLFSINIFLLWLIVPLFAYNNELLHPIQHELFHNNTYYNIT